MLASLPIGRFFNIGVFVHWSFWLLPLWLVLMHQGSPESAPLGLHLALFFAMFGCVVLHEFGHALTARRFGIDTRDITLYPIGGVARLERMTENPWEEFCIALAGPLVNVAIAVVLAAALFGSSFVAPGLLDSLIGEFFFLLAALNVLLVVFNLVPAFPMDGGRVFRALLAIPLGLLPATRVAVAISSALALGVVGYMLLAFVLGLAGIDLPGEPRPTFVLIALFVLWAGRQELFALENRARTASETEPIPVVLPVDPTLQDDVPIYLWDAHRRAWVKQGVATRPLGFDSAARGPA